MGEALIEAFEAMAEVDIQMMDRHMTLISRMASMEDQHADENLRRNLENLQTIWDMHSRILWKEIDAMKVDMGLYINNMPMPFSENTEYMRWFDRNYVRCGCDSDDNNGRVRISSSEGVKRAVEWYYANYAQLINLEKDEKRKRIKKNMGDAWKVIYHEDGYFQNVQRGDSDAEEAPEPKHQKEEVTAFRIIWDDDGNFELQERSLTDSDEEEAPEPKPKQLKKKSDEEEDEGNDSE